MESKVKGIHYMDLVQLKSGKFKGYFARVRGVKGDVLELMVKYQGLYRNKSVKAYAETSEVEKV